MTLNKKNSISKPKRTLFFGRWLTIGGKLICGVALASNLCIGFMLYYNYYSMKEINNSVQELSHLRHKFIRNLQGKVLELQNKYLRLPDLLKIDPKNEFNEWLKLNYIIDKETILTGRESFKDILDRTARRDVSKGKIVIRQNENKIHIFYGLFDDKSGFTNNISEISILTETPEADFDKIKNEYEKIIQESQTHEAIEKRILKLKDKIADEGFEAERTRNQILYHVAEIDKKEEEYNEIKKEKQELNAIIGIITIIINILVLGILTRIIVKKPINRIVNRIKDIAKGEGDLTARLIMSSNDELGELSLWFNTFVDKLREILLTVKDDINTLAESSENLLKISHDMAQKADQVSDLSKNVTAETEQTADNIRTMADFSEKVSSQIVYVASSSNDVSRNMKEIESATNNVSLSVSAVASAIDEIYDSLNEIAKSTHRGTVVTSDASEKANKTSSIVNSLGTAASEIGDVVELIRGIASQTNLLALNATIEAASAGEAGKGFTVVANEVKGLARQTSGATQIIRDKVETMQENTQSAINAIGSIVGVISEIHTIMGTIDAAVETQTDTINGISKNISTTADAAKLVNHNIQECVKLEVEVSSNIDDVKNAIVHIADEADVASSRTDTVLKNVTGVNTAVSVTSDGAAKVKLQANNLADMARQIQTLISQFKLV